MLLVAAPTFDASISEMVSAVASGAAVVVAPGQVYAAGGVDGVAQEQRVSAAMLTPTVLGSLDRDRLPRLGTVITAGEACPAELVAAWAPGRQMINNYGPTEATIWATSAPLAAGRPVTIGAPIPGMCALVLDARLTRCRWGWSVSCIWPGRGWPRDMWVRWLSAERFVANPFGGRRVRGCTAPVIWCAGRLAGVLDYLGRADSQVKLRGQRIELGEIENTLLACPEVTGAAGGHSPSYGTGDHLIRSISLVCPSVILDAVRARLGAWLPDYMVPAQIVVLEGFAVDVLGQDRPESVAGSGVLPPRNSGRRRPRPKRSSPRSSPSC